ncbi:AAA family ATPase [Draconibacterium sp. IB214405]|uniref:TrlF family AAA-like ATPase n=1 Tax=Draconibacterium sp. IB214405 TaxID=3097352 RepID=UPI002A0F8C48|nr:AAA family ATPase [Draconibacterium sp. IB214405]MDX8338917.1 AAA family ATPase [Draconibacterium sp. IB214405]
MTINRGSEWRKWDLHLHTPSSYDYKDKSISNQDIIDELSNNNIALAAITDHHVIDVERIKKLQDLSKVYGITILPGIEFLTETRGSEPIHLIAIFSENSNIQHIWTQLQSLKGLKDIEGLQKHVNCVYVDIDETISKVKELGGITTIHAGSKTNTVENITNALPHTIAQKTEIATLIDIYELGKESDQKDYKKIVFPAIKKEIPMVICSDNHDIKNYSFKQNTWIKADPTFEGLKQIIFEPIERVRIQENKPITPVHQISKIHINFEPDVKIRSENRTGKFCFSGVENQELNLSPYFNCIIGGRGTGKSTLLNLLTKRLLPKKELSFLTKNRIEPLRDDNFVVESTAESIEFLAQNEIERFANNSEELTLAVYDRLVKNNKKIRELENKLNDELSKAQKEISQKGDLGQKQSELKELESKIASKKKIISTYQDGKYKELNKKIESNSTLLNKVKLEKQEFFALKELVSSITKNHLNKEKENGSGYLKAIVDFVQALDELQNKYFSKEFTNEEAEIKTFESNIKNLQDELEDYLKQQGISKENLDDLKEIPEQLQIEITQQKEKSEQIKKIEEELKAISLANLQAIKQEYDCEVSSQLEKFNNQLKEISEKNPKHIKPIKLEFEFDEDKALDGIFKEFIKTYPPYNLQQENIRNSLFSILPKVILDENKTLEDLRERHHHWTKAGNYPMQCLEKDDNFEIYKCWIRKHYYDSITYKKINISYGETNLKDTSFGQRCTAVLIIMLGFGNTPIIIDEPEAHLDSGLIAEYLVELIKKKKQERQIIFATHNANFVINGDAEQILILTEDEKNRHTNFLLSSIENIDNKHQLLKLEGGNEAFKKREKKYNLD